MSALDDVLEYHLDKANVAALTHKTDQAERLSATNADARAELELLRDVSFNWAASKLHGQPYDRDRGIPGSQWCDECTSMFHAHMCRVRSILRTDPERARKMGLGWAL